MSSFYSVMNQILNLHYPTARPPWTKLGRKLESMCRKALYDFEMLKGVEKLAIALSGGKDSLSLLYLLKAISGRGFPDLEIYAIHVGGSFSCGAGVGPGFLKGICEELSVSFVMCESEQEETDLECYSCSRERRSLIFNAAKKVGATTVAFGHHRDDSAQTVLMNLMHKGEFAGILPKVLMHDYGVTIIRPLIYVLEEEIWEFAKLYGFSRVTCQCPVGQNSMRKKTKDLLKQIEQDFPYARENVSRAALLYGSQKALSR